MISIILSINAAALLLGVFYVLSLPRLQLPSLVRLALGTLATYVILVVALWWRCDLTTVLCIVIAGAVGTLALQGDGLARLTDALGKWRLALYVLSVTALAALVYLVVPIPTFLPSPGELDIHLHRLVAVNAPHGVFIVYIAALLYMFAFTPRMRTLLTLLSLSALGLALIYTYVAPFGYPALTGLIFEQVPLSSSSSLVRKLVDAALVTAVAPLLCVLLIRFGARSLTIGVALVGVSLGVSAGVRLSTQYSDETGGPVANERSSAQPLRFSRTQPNVLVIFLDRFMGSYIEESLQSHPYLMERLGGFTWYPRTVAAGENSIAGLHPLLGGYDYTPVEMNARNRPLRDLSTEAFSILPYNFTKHGYHFNLINPHGLGFTMSGDCNVLQIDGLNCTHIPMTVVRDRATRMGFVLDDIAEADYADLLVLLSAMRTTPYTLKEVLYYKGPWQSGIGVSAGTTFREWAQLDAFAELSFTDAQEPNFNFISSILPHEPHFLDDKCLPTHMPWLTTVQDLAEMQGSDDKQKSLYARHHANAARCTLLLVANYLDFLKQADVYDNTKIVIVSDHGIAGPVEDHSSRAVAGGTTDHRFVNTRSVLLVKERNATGALRTSEEFMPNAEVPRIVCEEISGCVNPYLDNRPIEAAGRDDPFYISLTPWQFSAQKPTSFVIDVQLELRGKDPFDVEGWKAIQ